MMLSTLRRALLWSGALFFVLATTACPGTDPTADNTIACQMDVQCPLGNVCLLGENVCGTAPCDFCRGEQICFTLEDGEKTCSRPECRSDLDCDAPEVCREGRCTELVCTTREDCPAGKVCGEQGVCVDAPNVCETNDDCTAGEVCLPSGLCRPACEDDRACSTDQYCSRETGVCTPGCRDLSSCGLDQICTVDRRCLSLEQVTSCAQVMCPGGQTCDPEDRFRCNSRCTVESGLPNSCLAGQVCNTATGKCVEDTCPGQDPAQCVGNEGAPIWSPTLCTCVECVDDTQCSDGRACNATGQCGTCRKACEANVPGTCNGDTPFCSDGCCLRCLGAADCAEGEMCLRGQCLAPPDCTEDPTICPPDAPVCDAGSCEAPAPGAACSSANPSGCALGLMCQGGQCVQAYGGVCGTCSEDCTCAGGLTCDASGRHPVCTGCDLQSNAGCEEGRLCVRDMMFGVTANFCL